MQQQDCCKAHEVPVKEKSDALRILQPHFSMVHGAECAMTSHSKGTKVSSVLQAQSNAEKLFHYRPHQQPP
jgi:hypothetical protein